MRQLVAADLFSTKGKPPAQQPVGPDPGGRWPGLQTENLQCRGGFPGVTLGSEVSAPSPLALHLPGGAPSLAGPEGDSWRVQETGGCSPSWKAEWLCHVHPWAP